MDIVKYEIVKYLEYSISFTNTSRPLIVKAKVMMCNDGVYQFKLSHHTKRKGDNEYYIPGGGALAKSMDKILTKLDDYINSFTDDYMTNDTF